jgi:hypothetical protein
MTNKDLTSKLEAIRELRAQHGNSKITIGMKEAHDYLKSQRAYMDLRDDIVKSLRENGVSYKPTLREVANFSQELTGLANGIVNYSIKNYALDNKFLERDVFVNDFLGTRKSEVESIELKFDYKGLMLDYFTGLGDERFQEGVDDYRLNLLLKKGIENGDYLSDSDGKKIKLEDLFDVELLKSRVLSLEWLADAEGVSVDEFLIKSRDYIKGSQFLSEDVYGFNEDKVTNEEMSYLFPSVFERAKKEQILNRLEVERLIAYNLFIGNESNLDGNVEGKLEELIREWKGRREKRAGRLDKFKKLNGPEVIIKNEERLFEEVTYELLVLKKNKQWLMKVMGN